MIKKNTPSFLEIKSASLVSSAGNDTLTLLAALIAGKQRFRDMPYGDTKITIAAAHDLVMEKIGIARLEALIKPTLLEQLRAIQTYPHVNRTHVCLILPYAADSEEKNQLANEISSIFTRLLPKTNLSINVFSGHCETSYTALSHCFDMLHSTNKADRYVLLAVDSLCDPTRLQQDFKNNLLYHDKNINGWLAGEAAACLVLEPLAKIDYLASTSFALCASATGHTNQGQSRWPSPTIGDGRGLQAVIEAALNQSQLKLFHMSHCIIDSDGSDWRSEDLSPALQRLQVQEKQPWAGNLIEPAIRCGQLGAAWGAFSWALTVNLHQHNIETINSALSINTDPYGHCAAAVLVRGTH